jgi:hypothetical protein
VKNKDVITVIMLFIIISVAGLGVYFSNGLTAYKENKMKYEEEKDNPEFNGFSKENISIYKFSNSEPSEYFIQLHNIYASSSYYPIGNNLPEDIILSRNLKDNTQLMIANDKVFIFEDKEIKGHTSKGANCHSVIWEVTEITDEIDKSNITNDLLSNENNYYKINTADLIEEDTLLK